MANKTKVIFLQEAFQSVLAVFPEQSADGNIMACYSHMGQHGTCDKGYRDELKEAEYIAYKPLLKELVDNYGYDLEILNMHNDPIKRAISSETEGRTILVYHDGCVKIFDQTADELKADVIFIDAEDVESKLKDVASPEEIFKIEQAFKAP